LYDLVKISVIRAVAEKVAVSDFDDQAPDYVSPSGAQHGGW